MERNRVVAILATALLGAGCNCSASTSPQGMLATFQEWRGQGDVKAPATEIPRAPVPARGGTTGTNGSPSAAGSVAVRVSIGDPAARDATLHPLMLGVISGPDAAATRAAGVDLTRQYQEIGVTAVRNNDYYDDRLDFAGILDCGGTISPSWDGCDPDEDSSYRWEASDRQFQHYLDGGFIPFLRIGDEWQNPSRPHSFVSPQNRRHEDSLVAAARRIADRYADWHANPNALEYLDIWTEFPGPHFWTRDTSTFYPFWIRLYRALDADHPELKIGGPGFAAPATVSVIAGQRGSLPEQFLTALHTEKIRPDWFGWHIFSSSPHEYAKAAAAYQDLLDGRGAFSHVPWAHSGFFDGTEVIVDAYGTGARDQNTHQRVGRPPDEEKAALLTAGWIALQYADVKGAFYYRGNAQGPSRGKGDLAGLFALDGQKKKAAEAFGLWSRITRDYPTLLTTSVGADGTSRSVWVLAATNPKGEVALLASNIADTEAVLEVQASGTSAPGKKPATVFRVDLSHDGTSASDADAARILLPADGVVLIELPR